MARKWEKVLDKAALITLGRKLIICSRSVRWRDEELRQLVRDRGDCFVKGLNKGNNWNEYLKIRKELKQKVRGKGNFIERNLWQI